MASSSSYSLVGVHTSSIFPYLRENTKSVPSKRSAANPYIDNGDVPDVLPEHATEASVLYDNQVHVLLRVLHDRRTIELVSLSTDDAPIRFSFPAPLIAAPTAVFDDPEIHVIACTKAGFLYRLVFPLPHLWNPDYLEDDYSSEYYINHPTDNLLGPVHVKEAGAVYIALKDGGILQLDAIRARDDSDFLDWNETVLRPPTTISLTSFIPFSSRAAPGSSHCISFATVPNPSPSLVVFSLQRDRTLRVWETGGCVATINIPSSLTTSLSRAGSVPPASKNVPILEPDPRRLLHVIPPDEDEDVDDGLRLIVFIPSGSGGYFSLYSLSAKNSSGLRILEHVGSKTCSERSQGSHFRDFIVSNSSLWVLWDNEGNSAVEQTDLDFEAEEDEQSPWLPLASPQIPEFSTTHVEDHLSTYGAFTGVFLSTLVRPGLFSRYTLRAALQQYTTALASLPGPHSSLLAASYGSLAEQIAAVVGCTVELAHDTSSGEPKWNSYWSALKRDWEGFVARCREIERGARWPLALGTSPIGEPFVLERERLCAIVKTDRVMQFHETVFQTQGAPELDPEVTDTENLLQIARAIRSALDTLTCLHLDSAILSGARQDPKGSYLNTAAEIADEHIIKYLPEEVATWLDQNIENTSDIEAAIGDILHIVTGLDAVKLEEDIEPEGDVPQLSWQTALTASYVTCTIQSRQDIALLLLTFISYVAATRPDLFTNEPSIIGQAFGGVQCISTLHYLSRRPAGDPEGESIRLQEDDVTMMLQNMHVSGSRDLGRNGPTYSLLHLLLSPSSSPVLSRSFHLPLAAAAHQFLLEKGYLRPRPAPSTAMPEVQLLREIWALGHLDTAIEVSGWLTRTPAVSYILSRVLLESGRSDDALILLERVGFCTGSDRSGHEDDFVTLNAVLPVGVNIESAGSYYRHVVGLFEALSLSEGIIQFAKLALENSEDSENSDMLPRLFKAHLDLGLYEDALVVILSTPSAESQKDFVRQLVSVMCDNDEIDRLVSLNFIGFHADVEEALAFKARNTDPRRKPHYAQVLHAWYVFRGDFRSAAAAMYQHGRRLQDLQSLPDVDLLETAVAQAMSYLGAINALSLVDSKNAWIEFPIPSTDSVQSKRRKLTQHVPEEYFATSGLDIEVLHLSEMKEEYVLVLSRLEVFREFPNIPNYAMSPEDIVTHFMQAGMLDSAMSAARSLKVDMTGLFGFLTAQCMRLAQNPDNDSDPAQTPWLLSDETSSWEGSSQQRAWRYLRISLDTHDTLDNDWAYRKVAFQKILDLDRFSRVPAWLIKFFEERQPEYLIRISLKYGLVRQALENSLSMVRKATAPLLSVPPQQASSTWLPYTLIDQVLIASDEEHKRQASPSDQTLAKQLRDEVKSRTERLKKWSANGR